MTDELIEETTPELVEEVEATEVKKKKEPINWLKAGSLKTKEVRKALEEIRYAKKNPVAKADKPETEEEEAEGFAAFSQIYRESKHTIRKKIRAYNRHLGRKASAKNKLAANPPMKEILDILKQKIYFIAEDNTSVQDELMVLGALQGLAISKPEYKIYFGTKRKDVYNAARTAWFVEKVFLVDALDDLKKIAKDDTVLEVSEPDILAAAEAEKTRYDADFEKLVKERKKYFEDARKAGVKDLKEDLPEYSFIPNWSKTTGYLWQITEDLGIDLELPIKTVLNKTSGRLYEVTEEKDISLKPYINTSSDSKRVILNALKKQIPGNQSIVLVDIEDDPAKFSMYSTISTKFPNAKMIPLKSLQQTAKKLGSKEVSLDMLATILEEIDCVAVVGSYGVLPYAAWAAGVNNICMLYDGNNPEWDTIDVKNKFLLHRSLYEDGQVAQALGQALDFMTTAD